jgi:Mn2+/Fe2+ NRAMP family transporter
VPILLVGGDRNTMGKHVNGRISTVLGWGYFCLICVLAVAAPTLFVVTNGGG